MTKSELEKIHTTKAYLLMILVSLLTLKIGSLILVALVPLFFASLMETDEINYEINRRKEKVSCKNSKS